MRKSTVSPISDGLASTTSRTCAAAEAEISAFMSPRFSSGVSMPLSLICWKTASSTSGV